MRAKEIESLLDDKIKEATDKHMEIIAELRLLVPVSVPSKKLFHISQLISGYGKLKHTEGRIAQKWVDAPYGKEVRDIKA